MEASIARLRIELEFEISHRLLTSVCNVTSQKKLVLKNSMKV